MTLTTQIYDRLSSLVAGSARRRGRAVPGSAPKH